MVRIIGGTIMCKVSVVVPVYNAEKYIRQCMDSLVNQTLQDIEIIVVNDGSTDGSLTILKEYEKTYPGMITVYSYDNQGVSHARNYGIHLAKGEYVAFVDSDDYCGLDMYEKLYNKAVKDQNDLVVCGRYDFIDGVDEVAQMDKKFMLPINQNFKLHDCPYELAKIRPFPWDKLFKRELISHFEFPEDIRFEDMLLTYEILTQAKSIGTVREQLYYYRRNASGSFLNSFSEATFDMLKVFDRLVRYYQAYDIFDYYQEELACIFIRSIYKRYETIVSNCDVSQLELKIKMVRLTSEFMDTYFPEWRTNRYEKYSMDKELVKFGPEFKDTEAFIAGLQQSVNENKRLLIIWKNKRKANEAKEKKGTQVKKEEASGLSKLIHPPVWQRYAKYVEKYPVDESVILVESKHGDDLAGNMFAILRTLESAEYEKYQVYLSVKPKVIDKINKRLDQYGMKQVKLVEYKEEAYARVLAVAKYLVTDTSFPTFFVKREGQIYLNTWHGTPFKGMGRMVKDCEFNLSNVQRNFVMADYLLYQQEYSKDVFFDDFMLEPLFHGKAVIGGYPRNKAFFNGEMRKEIRSRYEITNKEVLVYMPTWRGLLHKKKIKSQVRNIGSYLEELDDCLTSNQILYVKLHPYVKADLELEDFSHIKEMPEEYDTYDFLTAADTLITDYSSIMFDYAVSRKKIILFAYDEEKYVNERNVYLDVHELGFPVATDIDELAEAINTPKIAYDQFVNTYCCYDSVMAARNVVELMLHGVEEPFKVQDYTNRAAGGKVLIYVDQLGDNEKSNEVIREMDCLAKEGKHPYLSFKMSKMKNTSGKLSQLSKESGYISLDDEAKYSNKENMILKLNLAYGRNGSGIRTKLNAIGEKEFLKDFYHNEFETVIMYEGLDRMVFHMLFSQKGKHVFCFRNFQMEKYDQSVTYHGMVDYIFDYLDKLDVMYLPMEMEQLDVVKDYMCDKMKFISQDDMASILTKEVL